MQNPNEYDNEASMNGYSRLANTVQQMWEAGATIQEIEGAITTGFENCDLDAYVSIGVAPSTSKPHVGGGPKHGRA